jgi:hypothetical protein
VAGSPTKSRSVKVKCATWDQVEAFYTQKLKDGRTLTIRVPFSTDKGATVTLALGLPNDLVLAIDGAVRAVAPAGDGKRNAVKLELIGLTDEVGERLRALVADGRAGSPLGQPVRAMRERTVTEPPPPAPMDAPVDERVAPALAPSVDDVEGAEREVFLALEARHRRFREQAAHEVLGVAWDAEVASIRRSYFTLTKQFHPDVYARYRSAAVLQLAQEVFIHINKAYDRMRDAAVAAGRALVAGPALLPHSGWVAGLDDVEEPEPMDRTVRPEGVVTTTSFVSVPTRPQTENVGRRQVMPAEAAAPAPSRASAVAPPIVASPAALTFDLDDEEGLPPLPAELTPAPGPPAATDRPSSRYAVTPAPERAPMSPAPSPPLRTVPAPAPLDPVPLDADPLTADSLFGDLEDDTRGAEPAARTDGSGLFRVPMNKGDAQRVEFMRTEAEELMREGAFEQARDRLAMALHIDARNRSLRALYHVANGYAMMETGLRADAATQFETALKHDPDCEAARTALNDLRGGEGRKRRKSGIFRKLFEK